MFKPFQVLASNDLRLAGMGYDHNDFCWILVETHPDGKVARVIAQDGGEPEDQTLARDFSWVPDILNEYYINHRIELEALNKELRQEILLLKEELNLLKRKSD